MPNGNKEYICKNGSIITQDELLNLELDRLSDASISKVFNITRAALLKIRRKMGWPRVHSFKYRSDRGNWRVDPDKRRLSRNRYMREYYLVEKGRELGYKIVSVAGRKMLKQRWLMECRLKRRLKPGEIVAFKDGNFLNFDRKNLRLFSNRKEYNNWLFDKKMAAADKKLGGENHI